MPIYNVRVALLYDNGRIVTLLISIIRKEVTAMKKTIRKELSEDNLTMSIDEFVDAVGVGRYTALKLLDQSEAKIYVGRRVLVNIDKVKNYLNTMSE